MMLRTVYYPSRNTTLILHLVEDEARGNCFLFQVAQQIGHRSTFSSVQFAKAGAVVHACARVHAATALPPGQFHCLQAELQLFIYRRLFFYYYLSFINQTGEQLNDTFSVLLN